MHIENIVCNPKYIYYRKHEGTVMQTNDRQITDLMKSIDNGTTQLPDFQRGWVWDDNRIRALIASITNNFPVGAAMFLEYGNTNIRFKYRVIEGSPAKDIAPSELILDGQQRLTSIYSSLYNPNPVHTRTDKGKDIKRFYYIDIEKALDSATDRVDAIISIPETRLITSNFGRDIELDLSTPDKEYEHKLFPLNIILDNSKTFIWMQNYMAYHNNDATIVQEWMNFQGNIIMPVFQYKIPVILLDKNTPKEAVCQVFENVNTGGVSLTVFELITAVFAMDDFELRKDWEQRKNAYFNGDLLSIISATDFLTACTLLSTYQKGGTVSCKKKDVLNLTLDEYQKYADDLTNGFVEAEKILQEERIFSSKDLPYSTQFIPLAVLCTILSKNNQIKTTTIKNKIKQWYWCGVFGEMYGSANETRYVLDVVGVMDWISDDTKVPKTVQDSYFNPTRLLSLQSRLSAAYKGIMALILKNHCQDFISGREMDFSVYKAENIDIMDYFIPRLWLGMTATPDKRDDNLEGRNIYEIFNHQIAYEIRLQNAMEEDLLCPFHYFGITDLEIISDCGKSSEEKMENFRYLTSDTRVLNVMKQAEFFGYSGERVKGLIFCSRIDEAKELSVKFNEKGWRTIVLSGSDSESMREDAIERLTGDDSKDALDYIISVDIFSEGVDAPEINQVIMLRPTESPIVFIQQLGRGLRKAEGKEYVVVLDFIGNYRNNFMIPIALSGDRSYNKDNIRRYITEGGRVIPGASTIHFDEISRKRIFQAIDNANFSDIKLIRENYTNLKNKLGHIPALADFDKYGEMDVLRIFDNNSLGSYYKFLVKYEKEYKIRLSANEEKVIEFVSKKLASGKRIHELELLKRSLKYHHGLLGLLQESLSENYQQSMDENCAENIINMMTNHFPTNAAQKTYANCVFLEKEEDDYAVSKTFEAMLQNPDFYHILEELVDFGISRYHANYCNRYQNTDLVLYQKYTYEDVCRLLNWERNEVPLNIGGYKFDKKTKTFPIFINYDKQDDISDTTKYEDHFVGDNRLIAISKSGRTIASEDVQNFLHAKERGIDVQLFVRKNKDDKISKEFYYLGRVNATGQVKEFVMPNTDKTAVEIEWILDTPVREDIYEYIVNG